MRRSVEVTGLSLGEVWYVTRVDEQIPITAEFEYDGCGTHQVSLVWDDGTKPPPPPLHTPEEIAQKAADRKAGF